MSDGHPRTEVPTYIRDGYTDNKGDHAAATSLDAANSEHLADQDASDAIFVVVMVRPSTPLSFKTPCSILRDSYSLCKYSGL